MLNILALGLRRCLRKMTEDKINKIEKEVVKKVVKEIAPVEVSDKVENVKKKVVKKELAKKEVAVARGIGLRVSPKQCVYICKIIRGKSPDAAVARLQDVINERRAVPMAGLEVGHKKGKGLAGGRFPKNACVAIIGVVKQAGANAIVAGIENPVIVVAKSDRAAAPLRKGGRKAKRAHVYIEIRNREETLKRKGSKMKSSEKFDSSNRRSSASPEKFSSAGDLAKKKVEDKVEEVKKK